MYKSVKWWYYWNIKKNKQKTEIVVSKQESKQIKVKNNNQKIRKRICEL